MKSRKISKTVYITLEQQEALEKLSEKTKVPQSEYIREAIDRFLKDHVEVTENGNKVMEG
ncbi:MAG TPA: ribbon-helix-helix domain-containing protein [Thermodesulfobacteriota bacterium]|nr:ribbon-helix-helix domain-containing protein [Thermodesulfobacteriota bacterium]